MSSGNSLTYPPEDAEQPISGKLGTFDTLRIRNYRWFWLGTIAFFFGMQMQNLAQSWLAYQLTHSPLKLGIVSAAWGLPMFIVSPFSGVIIDRVQKRNLLILNQACLVAIMLALAILISTGLIQYWHLLITSALGGTTATFTMPCRQSIIPELVPRNRVYNAVALFSGATNLTQIAGPAAAGVLIGIIGIDGVYYCSLGCHIAAIASLAVLPRTSKVTSSPGRSTMTDLVNGLQYLRSHNMVLALMSLQFVIALLGMPLGNLMPVFAELLKVQAKGYGLLMTMVGIGALIGSISIASMGNFRRKGRLLLGAGMTLGMMLVFFANAPSIGSAMNMGSNVFYLAAFILVLVGIASTTYSATSTTTIMMNVKDEFRGRAMGIYTVVQGLAPLGTLLAGAIAQARGVSFTVTLCGVLLALLMLMMTIFNQRVRNLE